MFCIYGEEPQFAMEPYLPFQPQGRRPCHRRNNPYQRQMDSRRYLNPLNIFEQFLEEAEETDKEEQSESEDEIRDELLDEMEVQVQPEQSKEVAPKEITQAVTKFGSKVSVNETLEKVEIKVDLMGHKFTTEHLDVQVIDENLLIVKAEDGDKKFERKFKLPPNANIDKIESKFSKPEEDKQTMTINIPKEVKIVQVPIAMDE